MTEYILYAVLFLLSPAIVFVCLMFSYIFISPILCMWAAVFNLFGFRKPLELTKKHFPEKYYPKSRLLKKASEK